MLRKLVFAVGYAAVLVLFNVAPGVAAEFGTAEEAKAMLEKAVAAVSADKAKARDIFNKVKAAPRTVTFMSSAQTLRTAP
jgi:hypothetical protein